VSLELKKRAYPVGRASKENDGPAEIQYIQEDPEEREQTSLQLTDPVGGTSKKDGGWGSNPQYEESDAGGSKAS
jgi:hypothetical protein